MKFNKFFRSLSLVSNWSIIYIISQRYTFHRDRTLFCAPKWRSRTSIFDARKHGWTVISMKMIFHQIIHEDRWIACNFVDRETSVVIWYSIHLLHAVCLRSFAMARLSLVRRLHRNLRVTSRCVSVFSMESLFLLFFFFTTSRCPFKSTMDHLSFIMAWYFGF